MSNVPYLQAESLETQNIIEENIGQPVIIDKTEDVNDFLVDNITGIMTYTKAGAARKFVYIIAPQVARDNVCQETVPNIRCWLQKRSDSKLEFIDVPNANVLMNINTFRESKGVLILSGLITLESCDQLRIMIASNCANEVKIEYIPTEDEPDIPSIIVSIFNIGLEKDEAVVEAKTTTKKATKTT